MTSPVAKSDRDELLEFAVSLFLKAFAISLAFGAASWVFDVGALSFVLSLIGSTAMCISGFALLAASAIASEPE